MNRQSRLNAVLDAITAAGHVDVDALARKLAVSPSTIRRDLNFLAEQQLLSRTHGGAVSASVNYDLPVRYRRSATSTEKVRIGHAAASLIPEGAVVGLSGGTTTTEVARALAGDAAGSHETKQVTIVTNAINIASELTVRRRINLIVTGGAARLHSFELTGPLAYDALAQFDLDVAVLGVNELDPDWGAKVGDADEARINRLIVLIIARKLALTIVFGQLSVALQRWAAVWDGPLRYLEGLPMSFASEEIARQPQAWRKAAHVVAASPDLPVPGERVAVVGCGTSLYMATAYAALREARGLGETDAFAASEFPEGRAYDRYIAISRSGITTEVLDCLAARRGKGVVVVALTTNAHLPIADVADSVIALDFADERSVVQTLFATTGLAVLRAHLGDDIGPLADQAEKALTEPLDEAWLAAEQITFLGRGWAYGLAQEAALKIREASIGWTEAYLAMEYRHGPISIAEPGRVVWHLGPGGAELRDEVAATGALFVDHPDDPQADLVRVQRLAVERGRRAGLDPDRPRHLSRSVVLG